MKTEYLSSADYYFQTTVGLGDKEGFKIKKSFSDNIGQIYSKRLVGFLSSSISTTTSGRKENTEKRIFFDE